MIDTRILNEHANQVEDNMTEVPTPPAEPSRAVEVQPDDSMNFAEKLREDTQAIRFSRSRFGVRRSFSKEQKDRAAREFGADPNMTFGGNKLLNDRHPKWKAVSSVLNRAWKYWEAVTIDYPVSGVRLANRNQVERFEGQMRKYQDELDAAVTELEEAYSEMKDNARAKLGDLYDPSEYPASLRPYFGFDWEYPSVEPPNHLKAISPELYEQQSAKVAAQFQEALACAEEAFTGELSGLLDHLVERLSPGEDGKRKIFRNTSVENLQDFFNKFQNLSVGSNRELTEFVNRANEVVGSLDAKALRDDGDLRESVRNRLSEVKDSLDSSLVDASRRAIKI